MGENPRPGNGSGDFVCPESADVVQDGGDAHGERRVAGPKGLYVVDVQTLRAQQGHEFAAVVGRQVGHVRREGLDVERIVLLFVQGVEHAAGFVVVSQGLNKPGQIVHGCLSLHLVVDQRLAEGLDVGLVGHVADVAGNFVQQQLGEAGVADVADDCFAQRRGLLAVDIVRDGQRGQQFLVTERIQEFGQSGNRTGRSNLFHLVALVEDFLDASGAVVVIVAARSNRDSGPAEDDVRVLGQHSLDKRVQLGINSQEGLGVGHDGVQRETGQAGVIQAGDVALVVTGDDDPQVVRQAHRADGPEGGDGQGLGRNVRGRTVQLVQEQNRRLPGIGGSVLDGVMNDGMGIKHLLVAGVAAGVGGRNQTGAGEVGFIGQLVAGENEAAGVHLFRQGNQPGGLADSGLAEQHRDDAALDVFSHKHGEGVVEFEHSLILLVFVFSLVFTAIGRRYGG